jgi:hypothetical protein
LNSGLGARRYTQPKTCKQKCVQYLLPSGVGMVCSRRNNDEKLRLKNGDICVGTLIVNPPIMRVLVIDDDASVGAIQMTLVREGCDTVHAPDADAGIRAFDRRGLT